MSTEKSALTVNCPHCQRPVAWTADNPFKPFCSQRCKLIDLGEWVAETRKIPGDPLFDENFPDDTSLH